MFDALEMIFRTMKIRGRNPKCQVCGDNPTITDVKDFDYDTFCQTKCSATGAIVLPEANEISIDDFHKLRQDTSGDLCVVDVREPHQFEVTSLPGSINIPWVDVPDSMERLSALSTNHDTVYLMCRRGNDSKEATNYLLTKHGITNVVNVQ